MQGGVAELRNQLLRLSIGSLAELRKALDRASAYLRRNGRCSWCGRDAYKVCERGLCYKCCKEAGREKHGIYSSVCEAHEAIGAEPKYPEDVR